jgi:hypothetical protein
MFIDRGATPLRLRSEERNVSGVVKLYLNSAPPNGAGTGFYSPAYKHRTPNGVKIAVELSLFPKV